METPFTLKTQAKELQLSLTSSSYYLDSLLSRYIDYFHLTFTSTILGQANVTLCLEKQEAFCRPTSFYFCILCISHTIARRVKITGLLYIIPKIHPFCLKLLSPAASDLIHLVSLASIFLSSPNTHWPTCLYPSKPLLIVCLCSETPFLRSLHGSVPHFI